MKDSVHNRLFFVSMHFIITILIFANIVLSSNESDLYPSYSISVDPVEAQEWSQDRALAYTTTVRLYDYDHHIFQYRRYPCQYFYTDEIQLFPNNETMSQCVHNTTTNNYEYNFQLHLDSRHVEPQILKNMAIQCIYVNCSLSSLNITNVFVEWSAKGRENNPDCSFDVEQSYNILNTPYTISEWITLRCKSLSACNNSKSNIEQYLAAHVQIIYGSSYELSNPYCSLEKGLGYVLDTNFAKTNTLLQQLIDLIKRNSNTTNEGQQQSISASTGNISTTVKDIVNN